MAIYNEIIKTLGETIVEYNVGAWALFRDQMATEISSQYIFGNGKKPDESLLAYSVNEIQKNNRIVKGQQKPNNNLLKTNFTYYTSEGPVTELRSGPTLQEPESDSLNIDNDFKVNFKEQTQLGNTNYIYDEKGVIGNDFYYGLGKDYYNTNITTYENGETLLSKTKRWFQDNSDDYIAKRFTTTISRFHTDNNRLSIDKLRNTAGLQAFSNYGLSHGRNLLKKEYTPENESEYHDPYCRVWTWHKQYHRYVGDTMRPFQVSSNDLESKYGWDAFRSSGDLYFKNGGRRLQDYGVMYDNAGHTNGLVNITPSMDKDSTSYIDRRNVSVEHCMFSIENLAWKGTYGRWDDITETNGLSREQKGPLGGRIMWFPPYEIRFNENSQANWQSNDFIGRGEPIYTYANTTRSGTLSFKMLIDHPAILDYWNRRSEIGDEISSGTDNLDSKEQQMLRFFAGCEVLSAKTESSEETVTSQGTEQGTKQEEPSQNEEKVVQFFVFFPNNYSGKTDGIKKQVEPMKYLMNGVATNKYHIGSGQSDYGVNSADLPTNTSTKITVWGESQQVGGYEMREDIGISVVKNATSDNHIIDIDYGGKKIELVKMIGDKAQKSPSGTTKTWNKRRYYYRADEEQDVLNQVFEGEEDNGAVSYIDKKSYQLNSVYYDDAVAYFNIKDKDSTYSFAEVFVALEGDKDGVFNGLYREDKVELLKSIFNGNFGKINRITCKGRASSQGNNSSESTNNQRNSTLSRERARTVQKWLKSKLNDSSITYDEDDFTVDKNKNVELKDSNDFYAKLNRFAFVEIRYGGSEIEDSHETQPIITESGTTENESSVIKKESTSAAIKDNEGDSKANSQVEDNKPVRYDNEARFFEKLKENAPFMTKLLSERIKNFDPVFHSMSPEGFNARLTFLNQCMRQGPTISNSDTNGMYNANNLSFGRPPVCVLRIGDFYNTKIIITNMSIEYDPLVWDLNQEGIGVMPMIANISLQFYFIGGSDLGGPIQRLQNATSFNYYANASVYDNRAEEIDYENGDSILFKAYQPQ